MPVTSILNVLALAAVKGRPTRRGRLAVGVAMVVPKLVADQMLERAASMVAEGVTSAGVSWKLSGGRPWSSGPPNGGE